MTAGRIIFWRHGQTDWNKIGRIQGQADISLNELGRRQARIAAAALAELKPTHLYSSDLQRARQTADELAAVTGLAVRPNAGLREINAGEWSGLTHAQVGESEPQFFEWLADGRDFRRATTGETGAELGLRIATTVREIAEAHDAEDVVVITTHGMAARVGASYLMGLDFAASSTLRGLHNGAWLILEYHQQRWVLEAYNVTAAPPEPSSTISR